MDHSDDQLDFAPDDDLDMQQEIMLLKMKAFHNSSMTEEEYDIIREIIDNKNIITEKLLQSTNIKKYEFTADEDKPFISELEFLQTVALLKRKKNL